MPSHPAKPPLRRLLRARRAAQDPVAVAYASQALITAVESHETWRAARSVAAFVGVRGEPDTRPLLEAVLTEGRRLWLPRVLHGREGRSELVQVTDLRHLVPAGFGLLEPRPLPVERTLPRVEPDAPIDLILVPGLAFSRAGARLGFGVGHYDRLLAPIAACDRPLRMGVCLHAFLDPPEGPIPTMSHDVMMHWIATDQGVIRCEAPPRAPDRPK